MVLLVRDGSSTAAHVENMDFWQQQFCKCTSMSRPNKREGLDISRFCNGSII